MPVFVETFGHSDPLDLIPQTSHQDLTENCTLRSSLDSLQMELCAPFSSMVGWTDSTIVMHTAERSKQEQLYRFILVSCRKYCSHSPSEWEAISARMSQK
jgi:hypothetical protein